MCKVAELIAALCQGEEMKILIILFPQKGIESTACRVYSHTLVPLRHDCLNIYVSMTKLTHAVSSGSTQLA